MAIGIKLNCKQHTRYYFLLLTILFHYFFFFCNQLIHIAWMNSTISAIFTIEKILEFTRVAFIIKLRKFCMNIFSLIKRIFFGLKVNEEIERKEKFVNGRKVAFNSNLNN